MGSPGRPPQLPHCSWALICTFIVYKIFTIDKLWHAQLLFTMSLQQMSSDMYSYCSQCLYKRRALICTATVYNVFTTDELRRVQLLFTMSLQQTSSDMYSYCLQCLYDRWALTCTVTVYNVFTTDELWHVQLLFTMSIQQNGILDGSSLLNSIQMACVFLVSSLCNAAMVNLTWLENNVL